MRTCNHGGHIFNLILQDEYLLITGKTNLVTMTMEYQNLQVIESNQTSDRKLHVYRINRYAYNCGGIENFHLDLTRIKSHYSEGKYHIG